MEKITPSKHNPFASGSADCPNEVQRRKAAAMSAKIAATRARFDLPESYGVRLPLEPRAGDNFLPRFVTIPCPVVTASRARKRIMVIAPDGTDAWVDWK